MVSKLTPLRPSQKCAGEMPHRRSPRPGFVTPRGRVFLCVLALLIAGVYAAVARGADPPDPLVALLGIPSKPDGHHYYYTKTRFGHRYVCRIWAYGAPGKVTAYIEQCVTSKAAPKGPAS